jgi:hypothetical protein
MSKKAHISNYIVHISNPKIDPRSGTLERIGIGPPISDVGAGQVPYAILYVLGMGPRLSVKSGMRGCSGAWPKRGPMGLR